MLGRSSAYDSRGVPVIELNTVHLDTRIRGSSDLDWATLFSLWCAVPSRIRKWLTELTKVGIFAKKMGLRLGVAMHSCHDHVAAVE